MQSWGLNFIGKGINVDQIKHAFIIAKKAKLKTAGFFMLGHPYETAHSIKKTIDLAKELNPNYASFNIVTPYPGTPLFKMAIENGWLTTLDWEKYESTQYPVMSLNTISRDEVFSLFMQAYRDYYLNYNYIFKRISQWRNLSDIKSDFRSFLGLIKMINEKVT